MATVRADEVQLSIDINGEKAGKSLSELKGDVKTLNRELQALTPGTEKFRKKAEELGVAEQKLREAKQAAQEAKKAQLELNDSVGKTKGLFGGMPSVLGKLGLAIKSALAPLIVFTLIAELINLGKEALNVTRKFQGLREEVNLLTGATGDELGNFTSRIAAMGKTFDQDVNEVLKSANTTSKQMGISFDESLTLIEKGLIATGSEGDEFLNQVKEYGPQMKAAGLEAEAGFEIIARSIQSGVFTDKGIDAVKEFNLRIKDLSTGQQKVMEDILGKSFTDNIVTAIETGEMTSVQALSQISGKLGDLGADSADTQKVIANLFGGPGEDAGADFIISLQNVQGNMESVIDTSNVYVRRQIEQLELEKDLAESQEELSRSLDGTGAFFKRTATVIKTFFFDALVAVADYIKFFPDRWRIFRVKTIEQINLLGDKVAEGINFILTPLRALMDFLGVDIPEIELKIGVDKSSEQLQKELYTKIEAERQSFAEEQERQTLSSVNKRAEAERLATIREQNKTSQTLIAQKRTEASRIASEEAKAQELINTMMIEVMQEGVEKEIALLRLQADRKKAALKGNSEQIAGAQRLIEIELLEKIELVRQQNFTEEISKRTAEAQERIKSLKGSSETVALEQKKIEEQLASEIDTLIVQNEASRRNLLIEQTEKRKAVIISQNEVLSTEMVQLETELQTALKEVQNDQSLDETAKEQRIQALQEEYAQRRELIINESLSISSQVVQLERDLQTALKEVQSDQNIDETAKEQRIQALQEEYAVKKQTVISQSQETNQLLIQEEQQLEQELSALRTESQQKRIEAEKAMSDVTISETKKRFESEIEKAEQLLVQKNILAIQETQESLENGKSQELADEQLKQALIDNEREFLEQKLALQDQFGLSSVDTQRQIEQLKLDATKKRLGEQGKAEEEFEDEWLKRLLKVFRIAKQLTSSLSNLNQAVLDGDLAKIESNKKRELKAAGDNEAKKAAIKKKYDAEREKAEVKAAKRSQKISILETIINTAQSIIKTGATLGYPLAIPFQVIAAATGAAQLRAIRAQAFFQGGLTQDGKHSIVNQQGNDYYLAGQRLQQQDSIAKGGMIGQPTIATFGEQGREWVAPNWMVEHPQYGPALAQFEQIRLKGYALGGLTSPVPSFKSSKTSTPVFTTAYVEGGLTTNTTPSDTTVTAVQQQNNALSEQMLTELKRLRQDYKKIKLVSTLTEKTIDEVFTVKSELDARRSSGGL